MRDTHLCPLPAPQAHRGACRGRRKTRSIRLLTKQLIRRRAFSGPHTMIEQSHCQGGDTYTGIRRVEWHMFALTEMRFLSCLMLAAAPLLPQRNPPFEVEEATIAQVHAAMQAGQLTCRTLVAQYLK